ncbi:MAG: ribosome small subunit-dependent GTPase A [Bacteroidales bacterium]|jgi:ribosome biogenesis GTPase|nr:ribosome small subunit-dependent GTPase A [Bacteroidales bacterium]
MASGIVIKNTGNIYDVLDEQGVVRQCKVRGNFRLKGLRTTNPVAVGDRVEFEISAANRKHDDSKTPVIADEPELQMRHSAKQYDTNTSVIADEPESQMRHSAKQDDSKTPISASRPDLQMRNDTTQQYDSKTPVIASEAKQSRTDSFNWITAVAPRKNCLLRKSVNLSKQTHIIATNIDLAVVVASVAEPRTPQGFIDRTLISCEAYDVPAVVVFNKIDLETAALAEIYETAGYTVLQTSIITGQGIDELKKAVNGKTVLFTGSSGVGKSALINAIDPTLNIKVGEISTFNEKGKHTTTFAQMHPFGGGFLIDTPGIKEFGMFKINTEELSQYFPEMERVRTHCAYSNCTHTHEPHCTVKEMVETGKIHPQRYQSYLNILSGDEIPDPSLLENKNEHK